LHGQLPDLLAALADFIGGEEREFAEPEPAYEILLAAF
jgi:hypothetical protein